MDKRIILAIAALVTVGLMLGATGVMAKDVKPTPIPDDGGSEVAAALAAKLEAETGAVIDGAAIDDLLEAAEAAKGAVIDLEDVADVEIIDHSVVDDVSESAWNVNWVAPFKPWQIHYFPPHVPIWTRAAIIWDDARNDLDIFVLTAGGFDLSWDANSLTEEIDPISTYNAWTGANWGTFVAVNYWGGVNPQVYALAVDGQWTY